MTTITDERLDHELAAFLREHAEELYRAPDARGMAIRIAAREGSLGGRMARLVAQPTVRVAIVGLLLATVIGTAVAVGTWRASQVQNGLIALAPGVFMDPATGTYTADHLCAARCADVLASDATLGTAWSADASQMALLDASGTGGTLQNGAAGPSIWRYEAATDEFAFVASCGPQP
jgi:hypothetical protein